MKSTIITLFIINCSSLILSSCHSSNEIKKDSAVANIPSVLVALPQIRKLPNSFSIAGVAVANQEVKLFAMGNGYVKKWRYDIGDEVKKGAMLAQLENPELVEEQEKAKAELDGDAAIYNRFEDVYKKTPELIPLEQVDEARAKYGIAVAALNVVDSELSYLKVRAPFDGIITNRYVDTGAIVQNGLDRPLTEPLFKIQDISVIRVNVSVPEVNSPYILKNTPVSVAFVDLPNMVLNTTVSRIAYGLSEDTKTMLVQIDLSNKEHKIHPGMFANVTFMISGADSALSVPNQAVDNYEQQTFIFKVTPVDSAGSNWKAGVKCIVKKVNVEIGIRNEEYSQVKYGDLLPKDKVIIAGSSQCSDGSIVIAKEK